MSPSSSLPAAEGYEALFAPVVALLLAAAIALPVRLDLVLIGLGSFYGFRVLLWDRFDPPRWHVLDLAVVAITLAEVGSYWNSSYRNNSFWGLHELLFNVVLYFLLRVALRTDSQRTTLWIILAFAGFVQASQSIALFSLHLAELRRLGWENASDFRHFLLARGDMGPSPGGEWITLFLALLPFPLILFDTLRSVARWLALIAAGVVTMAALFTLSRGLIVAVVVFYIVGWGLFVLYRIHSLRVVAQRGTIAFVAAIVILSASPFRRPILTPLAMTGTVSQVRSLEGRQSVWRSAMDMVEGHAVWGRGSKNFALGYLAEKPSGRETVFVGRAFNCFLQILVEKGWVGLISYLMLGLAFLFVSFRKLRLSRVDSIASIETVWFLAAVTALVVRDLSYSSILSHRGVSALLFVMLAANATEQPKVAS